MPIILDMVGNYNEDKASLITKLSKGDQIDVRLATEDFPRGSSIDQVTIYANDHDAKGDSPGLPICGWRRSGAPPIPDPPKPCTVYTVVAHSETEVSIIDSEDSTATDRHWFGVSGTVGGTDSKGWSVDPELINK